MIIISFEKYIEKKLSKSSSSLKALEELSTSKIASNNTNKLIVCYKALGGILTAKMEKNGIQNYK